MRVFTEEGIRITITLFVSALIGLLTNYIAVKMLFRPYRPKYIGKWRIPFTPGIVPRRQEALAKGLGRMVSESLVQTEDLKKALLSDEISKTVAQGILSFPSIRMSGQSLFGEGYEQKRELVLDYLTDKILGGILAMDVGAVISAEAASSVKAFSTKNPLLGMFVTDHVIEQLAAPIGGRVNDFLQGDGKQKLRDALETELAVYEDRPVSELVQDTEVFERIIIGLYQRLVDKYAVSIASQFHLAEIAEEKIKAMPPEALEELLLSIMRKELNAVVLLGGLIGLIMGIINIIPDFIF
jgi:uncharacterized membrane protein YheB (UPF0754 family)